MSSPSIFKASLITLLLASCTSSNLKDLRDVPVSQVTLAESRIADSKLINEINGLRADPSKTYELAERLAELSLIPRAFEPESVCPFEAKHAARLIDSGDRNSRAYFLTRRALFFAMNQDGQHGARIVKPLLSGNWSDLDKAQIYNDLAEYPYFVNGVGDIGDYAVRALKLRVKAAGPHSLEVAESLITLVTSIGNTNLIDESLCQELRLPISVASTADEIKSRKAGVFPLQSASDMVALNKRREVCLRRAAQIREDILGGSSPRLAECLMLLGEKEKLRAVSIYERQFGSQSWRVLSAYSNLARTTKDPTRSQEYAKRDRVGRALQQAGDDPLKKAYIYLKSSLPSDQHQVQQDPLTSAYKSLGGNPPAMSDPIMKSDALGWALSLKELSLPELDWLVASTHTSLDSELIRNQLFIEGLKGKRSVCRLELPTWGGEGVEIKVIGKGQIRFRQVGEDAQGYQQVDYRWNGKTFEAFAGQSGAQDAGRVNAEIDNAVCGIWSYGVRGHHTIEHDLVSQALSRANATAQELFNGGKANAAADRLWIMFELTSDLINEASTGTTSLSEVDYSKDDVQKWIKAWTCKSSLCTVNLNANEWQSYLRNYIYFREKAGQQERARRLTETVF